MHIIGLMHTCWPKSSACHTRSAWQCAEHQMQHWCRYIATDHSAYDSTLQQCPDNAVCRNCMPINDSNTCWSVKTPILYKLSSYGRVEGPKDDYARVSLLRHTGRLGRPHLRIGHAAVHHHSTSKHCQFDKRCTPARSAQASSASIKRQQPGIKIIILPCNRQCRPRS